MIAFSLFAVVYCSKNEKKSETVQSPTSNAEIKNISVLNFTPELLQTKPSQGIKKIEPAEMTVARQSPACGGSFYGSKTGNGYSSYPDDTINAQSTVEGTTIRLSVSSYDDTPNRFTVRNPLTGAIVAASPWLGYANYSGPWGSSVTNTSGTLTFSRASSAIYILQVETMISNVNGVTSDSYQANSSCTSPSSITRSYAGVTITYYSSTGMLRFNSSANLTTVLDRLDADYESYNTNYENQFPNYTADQLDFQDSISNFNPYQPIVTFENLFPGFISKRKDLQIREDNWLNTVTTITETNNPDSLDFSSDFIDNTIANISNKFIIGTDTYEYKENDIYRNGVIWDDESGSAMQTSQEEMMSQANPFCSWCADCKNWKRRPDMSDEYIDDQGRNWSFLKVIAIRGINARLKGQVVGSIKSYREVRPGKWKKKRAWLGLHLQGYLFKNRCNTPYLFGGVYSTARPRYFYRRRASTTITNLQFYRTKRNEVIGTFPCGQNQLELPLVKICR